MLPMSESDSLCWYNSAKGLGVKTKWWDKSAVAEIHASNFGIKYNKNDFCVPIKTWNLRLFIDDAMRCSFDDFTILTYDINNNGHGSVSSIGPQIIWRGYIPWKLCMKCLTDDYKCWCMHNLILKNVCLT